VGADRDGTTMVVVTHEMGFVREDGGQCRLHGRRASWSSKPAAEFVVIRSTPGRRRFLSKIL
jgi:ABC-type polar amino acid transport system ATPase subunit